MNIVLAGQGEDRLSDLDGMKSDFERFVELVIYDPFTDERYISPLPGLIPAPQGEPNAAEGRAIVAQEGAPAAQVVRPVPYYDTNTDQTIRNRNFLPNPSAPVPPETRFVYHNVEDALAKVSGSHQFSDSVRAILSQKMLCDLSSSLNYHFLTQTGLAFGFTGLSPNNVVFTLTRLTEHHDQGQPEPEFLEYKLKIVNSLSQSPWMGNLYDDQIFEGQLEGRINLLLTHQTRTDKVRAKVIEANLAYNINRIFTQGV